MKIKELASQIGEHPKSIRSYLRKNRPRPADNLRQRWQDLSPEVCKEISNHFHLLRGPQPKERAKEKHPHKGKAKEKEQRKHQREITKAERIKLELAGLVDIQTGELLKEE